jgi:TusA-related sulfurtransferase
MQQVKQLDLSSDKCPTNYLKAKWELLKCKPGEQLKLVFADEKIAQTVLNSLKKDGFTVSNIEIVDSKFVFFVSA